MNATRSQRRSEQTLSTNDLGSQMLDPERIKLWFGPGGEFRCEIEGDRCYLNCRASRCFPFSDRRRYVALFDGLKGEIGAIYDPGKLDPESLKALDHMLERRYFIPIIEQVKWLKEEYSVVYWSVDTNVGPRDFVCRGLRDAVTELEERRLIVTDVDGNRFEIPDYDQLNRATQALLDRVL